MKNSISRILLFSFVAVSLCFLSCNKKNLDLLPHGPTEASYFLQESDFSKAIFGVYAKLSDVFWYNGGNPHSPMLYLAGDDITTNASAEPFEVFGSLQPTSGDISSLWATYYQLIARANVVLGKIEAADESIYVTPSLKNSHKGEALFLRGWSYFNLWNYWKTAPLRNERVVSNDQFLPSPSEGTQLLDQAILDFTQAAELLPENWEESNRGRSTKNAANGMLGKSWVFKASATKNIADYSAAITAFNKIAGITLTDNFDDNFSPDLENNSESLFEYQATQPFAFDNVWLSNDFDNPIGSMSAYWGYYSNHWSLFGKSQFFATPKLVSAFEEGDPRLDKTLSAEDRSIRKYVNPDKLSQSGVASVNNPRLLRFSDVLLLKAEAVLQSDGSASEAITLINQVRTRARNMVNGGTAPANYSVAETDKTVIMNWIMKERFIELAGEGQRWFDLRRWQMQGIITLDNSFFNSNVPMAFDATKHLDLPIPNSELDVNPNMRQNPNY